MSYLNFNLWFTFIRIINLLDHDCAKAIEKANLDIDAAKKHKKEDSLDYFWTDVMGEADDGSARKTNAELTIKLAEETMAFCQELKNTFEILKHNQDSRLLPDVYTTLKKHLDDLNSEYSKIPKNTGLDVRTNDLNDIRRYWIEEKMEMVNSLLRKLPAHVIASARANARKEPAPQLVSNIQSFEPHEQLGGRKRTGRKRSGKKRSSKKRKSTTRRK